MYFVKTPWWLKKLYPQLVWNKARTTKTIFLTFDDGPIPIVTPGVLNILKSYNAKATFFCIGDNIIRHPDIFLQLKADGHSIGNHTQNHLKGWVTPDDKYIDNFNKCQNLTQTNLFRPPYGRIKRSQIFKIQNLETELPFVSPSPLPSSHINTQIIMWDVLSGDFDITLKPEKCLKNVLKHTQNGSIVVFHDSLKAWDRVQYVLPKALEYWQKQGFRFGVLGKN